MAEAKKTTTKKSSSTTAKKTTTTKKSTTAKKTTTAAKKPSTAKKTTAKKNNTKAVEKAINNTYHIEDSQLEKMSKIELENEVKTLEFKLHELEDDNLHLMERIHKLTIDHKSGSNTMRISKEIVVDEKDPFNSMYGDRATLNARKNF